MREDGDEGGIPHSTSSGQALHEIARSEKRASVALGMAGRSGRHWWAGSDRGAGSRLRTPG